MRGLVVGTAYGLFVLSAAFSIVISIPFRRNLPIWSGGIISCGFWHALLLLAIEIVACIRVTVMKFTLRKRQDAERYYDKDSNTKT